MVLGKLPVPGRPAILDNSSTRACAYIRCGWGCLDIFSPICHFSLLSPSLWETALYRLQYCLKGQLTPPPQKKKKKKKKEINKKNKKTNQPIQANRLYFLRHFLVLLIFFPETFCITLVMYKTIFVINIVIYMCLQHSNVL